MQKSSTRGGEYYGTPLPLSGRNFLLPSPPSVREAVPLGLNPALWTGKCRTPTISFFLPEKYRGIEMSDVSTKCFLILETNPIPILKILMRHNMKLPFGEGHKS